MPSVWPAPGSPHLPLSRSIRCDLRAPIPTMSARKTRARAGSPQLESSCSRPRRMRFTPSKSPRASATASSVLFASTRLLAEALVEPVDQLGHGLEPVGDHAQAVLAEVLRLDAKGARERLDHVVRGHPA